MAEYEWILLLKASPHLTRGRHSEDGDALLLEFGTPLSELWAIFFILIIF